MNLKEKKRLKDIAGEVHRKVALVWSENEEDWRRDHLGASIMGKSCDRYVWMSYRWALRPDHDHRMLRLFDRGDLEEHRFGDELVKAGYKFRAPDGSDEFRWSYKHLGGECDGIIDDFIDGQKAIAEMKTHSLKSFTRLLEKGVRGAKREHWYQMQLYMLNLDIKFALYCAVNKNNDELYYEVIPLDRNAASERMERVLEFSMKGSPPPVREPDYSPCMLVSKEGQKYPCDYHSLCFGNLTTTPERNCRTCMESYMTDDGGWKCGHHNDMDLDPDLQREGCPDHLYNTEMINAQISSADQEKRVVNYIHSFGNTFEDARNVPQRIAKMANAANGNVTKSGNLKKRAPEW